jgi:uncharacterized protein (DUF983 family)
MIHARCPSCGCPRFTHTIHRCPPLLPGGQRHEAEPADGSLFFFLIVATLLLLALYLSS